MTAAILLRPDGKDSKKQILGNEATPAPKMESKASPTPAPSVLSLSAGITYTDLIGKTIVDSYGNVYPAGGVSASLGTWDRKYTGLYLNRFTVDSGGNLKVYGQTILGDSASDYIKLVGRLSNDIVPSSTNEISLGDGDRYFKKGYINQIIADTGGANTWIVTTLTVNGISTLTGNVGIGGTATLSSALCLNGECKTSWTGSGNYTASNGITLSGVDFQLGGRLSRATGIDINSQNFGFLGGNVGIGTTNPKATFNTVFNGGKGEFRVKVADGNDDPMFSGDTMLSLINTGETSAHWTDFNSVNYKNGQSGFPNFGMYNAGGTMDSPSTLGNSQIVGELLFRGYNSGFKDVVQITVTTDSNFTSTNLGHLGVFVNGENLSIISSGNVGIGFTSPNSLLHIGGANNTTSAYGIKMGSDITLYRSAANTLKTDNNLVVGGPQLLVGNGSATLPAYSFSNLSNAGLWTNGDGLLLTTGGSNTKGITITGAGNVGIGTTNPGYKLEVNGSGYISNFLGVGGSLNVSGNVGVGGSITGFGALSGLNVTGLTNLAGLNATAIVSTSLNTGAITATSLTTTGNVGVGGSITGFGALSGLNVTGLSNLAALNATTINASSLITSGNITSNSVFLAPNGSATAPAYSFSNETDTGLWRVGTNLVALTTGSTPAAGSTINGLSVNSSGNVGIGTTAPTFKLDVTGDGRITTGLTVGTTAANSTTRASLTINGDETLKGKIDLVTSGLSGVTDVFIYDTTKDSDGGKWRNDERAKSASWYNETIDATGAACDATTNDRCGRKEFPEKAIIIGTGTYLYIYDAKDNTMWMRFDRGGGVVGWSDVNMIGSTSVTIKAVQGLNGKIYAVLSPNYGSVAAIDFKADGTTNYTTSNIFHGRFGGNIFQRNTNPGYVSISSNGLVDYNINDIRAREINGKTYIAVATDTGVSIVNETEQVTYDYADNALDDYNQVWLDASGNLWATNETTGTLEKWNNVINDSADENPGTPDATWDETTTPTLTASAPTIQTTPGSLYVTDGTSTIDGKSPTIYIGTDKGLTVLQTKAGDETNGSVKYYTKDYITEEMVGDVRGMWGFSVNGSDAALESTVAAASTLGDASLKNSDLTVFGNTMNVVTGVRGKALQFDGSTNYLKSTATTFSPGTGSMSAGAWINASSASANGFILNGGNNDTLNARWVLLIGEGGDYPNKVHFEVRDASVNAGGSGGSTAANINDDKWHFVVGVRDTVTDKVYIYVDGIQISSGTDNSGDVDVSTGQFWVGVRGDGASLGLKYTGYIDEPFVTMTALTPGEIKHMYEVGKRALDEHTASRITGVTGVDNYQRLMGNASGGTTTSNTVKAVALDSSNQFIYAGVSDATTNTGGVTVLGVDSDSAVDLYDGTANTGKDDDAGTQFSANDVVAIGVSGTPVHAYNSGTTTGNNGAVMAIAGTNDTATRVWMQSSDYSLYSTLATLTSPDMVKDSITATNIFKVFNTYNNYTNSSTGERIETPALSVDSGGNLVYNYLGTSTSATAMNFTDSILTTGTTMSITSSALTTGSVLGLTANALTSGTGLNLSSSSTAMTGALEKITLSGSNSANTGSLLEILNSGTANTNTSLYVKHYATGTNNLAFRVDDVSGDTTPFVIAGDGNVGIGTASPLSKLGVLGSAAIGATYGALAGPTSGLLVEGNVGVGTTSPLANLHVVGQCVTGDTLLRRRRKKLKVKSAKCKVEGDGKDPDPEDDFEDIRIDQIQPGDEILTLDESTGEFIVSKVNKLMDMGKKDIIKITTVSGKTIRTTSEHPYLVKKDDKNQIDFILNHSFEEAKKLAHDFYFGYLDKTSIKVPALSGEKVYFTREGWEHLLREKRSTHELLTRLFTLTRVAAVLENTTRIVDHDSRMLIDKNFDTMEYWVFEEIVEGILVKVVIASYEYGPKFFLSAIWKGTKKVQGIKKELSLACNPRRRRMITSQLFNEVIISQRPLMSRENGRWTKVKNLKVGAKIATVDGWEKIAKIEHLPSEQVFDIEVEGTHNFVGNDIVAHNTILQGLGTTTGLNFRVQDSGGADKFSILDNGNVGIGTTGPNNLLEIRKDQAADTAFWINNRNAASSGATNSIIFGGYRDNDTAHQIAKISALHAPGDAGDLEHAGSLAFYTQPSLSVAPPEAVVERMRITSTGNVGIGTILPTGALQVNSTSGTTPFVVTSTGNVGIGRTNPGSALTVIGNVGIGTSAAGAALQVNGGGLFGWGTASVALSSGAIAGFNGNVGVGTTSPRGQLEVWGNNTTSALFLNGNVGIGFTSPSSLLTISSQSNSTSFSAFNLDWSPPVSTVSTLDLFSLNIGANGIANSLFNIYDNSSSVFSISQTALTTSLPMNITSPGDVGMAYDLSFTNSTASFIKSASPLSLIAGEIYDSSNLTLGTYNFGQIVLDSSGGVTLNQYQPWTLNDSSTMAWNILNSSGTTLMSFDTTNGNVGIGRTGPYGKLSVFGAGSTTGITFATQGTTTQGLAVLDSGNVGIGTTNPGNKLEVVGAVDVTGASAGYKVAGSAAIDGARNFLGSTISLTGAGNSYFAGNVGIGFTSPAAKLDVIGTTLLRGTNGIYGLAVTANGNVGIGTTSPTAQLEISGSTAIKASGSTWDNPSDARLKDVLGAYGKGLDEILKVNPIRYTFKEGNGLGLVNDGEHIGIVAQDIQSIFPEAVKVNSTGYLTFQADPVIWAAVNAIKELESRVKSLEDKIATSSAEASSSAAIQNTLELTPPDILLASGSATLADIQVVSQATFSGQLTAYEATIQETFKSLGKSFLGKTIIAGDLTVDGTMSLTGNSLSTLGTLFLQNGLLAGDVDIFNGKVVIDKNGNLATQSLTIVNSDPQKPTIGSGKLLAGQTQAVISTLAISGSSKIFITPTSFTGKQPLVVTQKTPGVSFTVSIEESYKADITFDWWVVESRDAKQEPVSTPSPSPSSTPAPSPSLEPAPKPQVPDWQNGTGLKIVAITDPSIQFARVRIAPDIDSGELTKIYPGTGFKVLDEQNGWYEIEYQPGVYGWVKADLVSTY